MLTTTKVTFPSARSLLPAVWPSLRAQRHAEKVLRSQALFHGVVLLMFANSCHQAYGRRLPTAYNGQETWLQGKDRTNTERLTAGM